MTLLFCRSRLPGSYASRALTCSGWSHVALVLDHGVAIEATWPRVRAVPVEEVVARHSAHAIATLPGSRDTIAVSAFALAQCGKRYDLSALFGLLAQRDWQTDDAWFCSELVAAAANAGGERLFRSASRVTPQMLWELTQ